MDRAERLKKINTAAAAALLNVAVPAPLRDGIAAIAEEIRDQRARLDALEAFAAGRIRGEDVIFETNGGDNAKG